MSGRLKDWAVALALALGVAGCGGSPGDNAVSQAAHAGLNTMQAAMVGHMQAGEARDFIAAHPEALVLDIRTAAEWDGELGHIASAKQIPLGELVARMGEIESWKAKPVVVVDRDGTQSRSACQVLASAGFQQVSNLEGGMVAWHQGGDQ